MHIEDVFRKRKIIVLYLNYKYDFIFKGRVTIMDIILEIGIVLIGVWQMYATIKYFRTIKEHGNSSTSPFSLVAIFSSFSLSIFFIIIGLTGIFNLL